MLPSGHAAAGYLTAYGAISIVEPALQPGQFGALLFWGAFFGFLPDIDMFYAFAKARGFTLPDSKVNHRAYLTHRPMFWLVLAAVVFLVGGTVFWQMFALVMLLGAWSHFLLDSFKVGVKWLWPFTNRYFAFASPGQREGGPALPFFRYWFWFLGYYRRENALTFYLEVLILAATAVVVLAAPRTSLAHTTETHGEVTALFHVEPNHEPIAGQQSAIAIELKDGSSLLTANNCNCTLAIVRDDAETASFRLFEADANSLSETVPYVFPEAGTYTAVISGQPGLAKLSDFSLSHEISVKAPGQEAGSAVQNEGHSGHGKTDHTGHYIIFGAGGVALAGYWIHTSRKKRKTQDSIDNKS